MATTEEQARGAASEAGPVHGGRHVARALKSRGVTYLFTLSGGHLFSIYDGCKAEGIEVVDTRHEASAAWAAEGFAKATRRAGVCALTAGPGVTNGMSPMAGAQQNRSPPGRWSTCPQPMTGRSGMSRTLRLAAPRPLI